MQSSTSANPGGIARIRELAARIAEKYGSTLNHPDAVELLQLSDLAELLELLKSVPLSWRARSTREPRAPADWLAQKLRPEAKRLSVQEEFAFRLKVSDLCDIVCPPIQTVKGERGWWADCILCREPYFGAAAALCPRCRQEMDHEYTVTLGRDSEQRLWGIFEVFFPEQVTLYYRKAEAERIASLLRTMADGICPAKPPPCEPDIFRNGFSICAFDAPAWIAEAWVVKVRAASGQRVDWHYSGGVVHVLMLGDRDKVLAAIAEIKLPPHEPLHPGDRREERQIRIFDPGCGLYRHGDPVPEGVIGIDSTSALTGMKT